MRTPGITALSFMLAAQMALAAAPAPAATPEKFSLSSAQIAPGRKIADEQVFNAFGCSGKNISPSLAWKNPPAGTKSFALMVHDPDAPTGSGWWHWVVINIPASVNALAANAGDPKSALLPKGAVHGVTDFGSAAYGGPCPPAGSGPHHYHFRLFALKVASINVPAGASAALIGFNVRANALAVAELTGVYSR